MGMSTMSSCASYSCKQPVSKNPDPKNFRIIEGGYSGNYTIIKIHYPNCNNYEGIKILMYAGHVLKELMAMKEIDPHFCNGGHLSPIARFEPSEEGLALALSIGLWKK